MTIGEKKPSMLGLDAVLDFDVAAALGDARLSPEDVEAVMAAGDGLVLFKGKWVELDRARLQEAIVHRDSLRRDVGEGGISFIEGVRLLAGASSDLNQERHAETDRIWVHLDAGEAMRSILAGLRDPARLGSIPDDGLRTTLRPYQQHCAAWLDLLAQLGLGACLADDMGLGKTIQILALLLRLRKSSRRPSLLVVRASLLGNWRAEAERFAPSLRLAFNRSKSKAARLRRVSGEKAGATISSRFPISRIACLAAGPMYATARCAVSKSRKDTFKPTSAARNSTR